MVQLLALAHERNCEAELASCLTKDLEAHRLPSLDGYLARFAPDPQSLPEVHVQLGSLADYDALLVGAES